MTAASENVTAESNDPFIHQPTRFLRNTCCRRPILLLSRLFRSQLRPRLLESRALIAASSIICLTLRIACACFSRLQAIAVPQTGGGVSIIQLLPSQSNVVQSVIQPANHQSVIQATGGVSVSEQHHVITFAL